MLVTTGLDDTDHLAVIGAGERIDPSLLMKGGASRANFSQWTRRASAQGVSEPSEELDYLPLSGFTKLAPAGPPASIDIDDALIANPQRPFRGERLVLTALLIAVGGATTDALFRLIISPAIYVGATQVGASQGDMPGQAFGPTAFGVRLSFPTAGQGTRVYIPFQFHTLLAGETLIVAGGIFGRAVR